MLSQRLSTLWQRPLVGNAIALYAVQGLNYLMPLVLLPFLLRALQPQGYGAIMFAQSLLGYAVIVVEFGFNFTAARDISVVRHDPAEVARIYWTTTAAKLLLLLAFAVLAITIIVMIVPAFRASWPLYAASGLLLVGNVVFPQWYFQGLERLKEVALIQAVAKCVVTVAAILLVRSPDDMLLAAIILASPQVAGALAGLCLKKPMMPEQFHRPTFREIRSALRQSKDLFVANIATTLYLNTNTIVLGILSGEVAVAAYSVATRIISTIQSLAGPLVQAVFPRASLLFSEDRSSALKLVWRVSLMLLPAVAVVSSVVWVFAPQIVTVLGGQDYREAISALRIMLPIPVLVSLGMLLAHCVMVNMGLSGALVRVYLFTGAMNLAAMPFLVNRYGADGAAVSWLMSEVLIEIILIWLVRKHAGSHATR